MARVWWGKERGAREREAASWKEQLLAQKTEVLLFWQLLTLALTFCAKLKMVIL